MNSTNAKILDDVMIEIDKLLENDYDWEEIDYIKPTQADIDISKEMITEFVKTIDAQGYTLEKPYVSAFEEGGASMKWDIDDRTLYVEICQKEHLSTRLWYENGKLHVRDFPFNEKEYLSIWKWIIGE